jgi:thymidylate synthase (FAD)
LSARYRPLPEEFYVPEAWVIGVQNSDNKQMRDITSREQFEREATEEDIQFAIATQNMIRTQNEGAFRAYRAMIENEVPRELARSVLPVGTYSHMFAKANLHNWLHFLAERLNPHAQYEIRVYAQIMLEMIREIAPVATAAFDKKMEDAAAFQEWKEARKSNG